MNKKSLGIATQITLLVIIVSVINIMIATFLSYKQLRQSYLDAKLMGNTEIAQYLAENFRQKALRGELPLEEAKQRALMNIGAIRFDGGNYLTVVDGDVKVLESPVYTRGTDGSAIADPKGKRFLKELADTAKVAKDDIGSSIFEGTLPGSNEIVKKIGSSREYKAWGWVFIASIAEKNLNAALWSSLKILLFSSLLIIVLTVIGVQVLYVRGLTKTLAGITSSLENSTVSVSGSATSLEDSSQRLAEGTNEQAASVQEIVATIEESTSMIKKTDESSSYALKLAQKSKENATRGYKEMNELMVSMDKIDNASKEISKIIKIIDEIALQTNILSLNAAVEAEKAGEAGKGFAVVAEEVRNLAQRSAQSVKDTTKLIENNAATYREAAKLASQVHDSIQEIEKETGQVNELINEVAAATREQKIGMEQIHAAISQVDQVLQVNARTAGDTSEDSQHLTEETHTLNTLSEKLISFVKGSS